MRQRRARTENLAVEPLPGIGRTYEMTDLDGDRVGVVVHRRGGRNLFIWPAGDTEPAAVAALSDRQARLLALVLCDLGPPSDGEMAGPELNRSDRLLSHAGTPLPPSDPSPRRPVPDSPGDRGPADSSALRRLPWPPPSAVDRDPPVLVGGHPQVASSRPVASIR
jgi:TrkA domain protein